MFLVFAFRINLMFVHSYLYIVCFLSPFVVLTVLLQICGFYLTIVNFSAWMFFISWCIFYYAL